LRKHSPELNSKSTPLSGGARALSPGKQCGFPGARGLCLRPQGSCPFHPIQAAHSNAVHQEGWLEDRENDLEELNLSHEAEAHDGRGDDENDEEGSESEAEDPCEICSEHTQPNQMLACDGCDRGYHMFCLQPSIVEIPSGDWFCVNCQPQEADATANEDVGRGEVIGTVDTIAEEEVKDEADREGTSAELKETMDTKPIRDVIKQEEEKGTTRDVLNTQPMKVEAQSSCADQRDSFSNDRILELQKEEAAEILEPSEEEQWEYNGQLSARTVLEVYVYWLKKVVTQGKPQIRIGDERVCTWLREAAQGTIYEEEEIPRSRDLLHHTAAKPKPPVNHGGKPSYFKESRKQSRLPRDAGSPGGDMCGVLSKRNNPCTQPAATCRYHGAYANGRSRSRDVGMEEESEDDEDGKFLDEEEDEEVYEMQHEEEDELMDHGSDEGDVHGESDDDKEDDDEVELSDSHDDENEVDDNLERFQQHFLHKNMPNMLYMDAAYTELCMF